MVSRDTAWYSACVCSGSVQTLGVAGCDGAAGNVGVDDGGELPARDGANFSDDEVSLSPPRHSYVLEFGPRHQAYHTACSDDELAITSSDDAIGLAGDFCGYEPAAYGGGGGSGPFACGRPRSRSQGRYSNRYTTPHAPHYYPDAL